MKWCGVTSHVTRTRAALSVTHSIERLTRTHVRDVHDPAGQLAREKYREAP